MFAAGAASQSAEMQSAGVVRDPLSSCRACPGIHRAG